MEYQVLVPDFIRRQLQGRTGQEVTLHTSEYLDGNPMQGRVVPRFIGFLSEAELEFFELFCTVALTAVCSDEMKMPVQLADDGSLLAVIVLS